MSAWLVVESSIDGWVDVLNLEKVVGVQVVDNLDRVEVAIVTQESEEPWRYALEDLTEVEKLINLLPQAEKLGWIYIRDGKVDVWRGGLKLLQKAEGGE
ncbi:protein of unknown function [Thermococcus nautili]|uniref:hypothetical protein n=1 Tax=Thermococcus nautili TaxID=195522 RepID=UPI00255622FD|nr:hypothetical protein [Thermococcus nautili]CAI1492036.1 protein of unknown function [Thermococcus nautili]